MSFRRFYHVFVLYSPFSFLTRMWFIISCSLSLHLGLLTVAGVCVPFLCVGWSEGCDASAPFVCWSSLAATRWTSTGGGRGPRTVGPRLPATATHTHTHPRTSLGHYEMPFQLIKQIDIHKKDNHNTIFLARIIILPKVQLPLVCIIFDKKKVSVMKSKPYSICV